MGRAIKWLRAILCLSNQHQHNQKARKWIIFGKKSSKQSNNAAPVIEKNCNGEDDDDDDEEEEVNVRKNKVASAVSMGGEGYWEDARREDWAAIVVQSHFRGYLARRALWALRGLVKLQALARGHLARKQTAHALRRLRALIRSDRVNTMPEFSRSTRKSSPFGYTGPTTPENSDRSVRARNANTNRNDRRKYGETTRAHSSHLSRSSGQCCQSYSTSKDSVTHQSVISQSSTEVQSMSRNPNVEEAAFYRAADSSPRLYSSSSSIGGNNNSSRRRERRDTPTRSDGTRSCFSNYSDHPSYMAYTESSKAKVRSLSVPPKQRKAQREASSSGNSGHSRSHSKTPSNSHGNYGKKGVRGIMGRTDIIGMPAGRSDSIIGLSGGLRHRY